jgi:hypothetical protein
LDESLRTYATDTQWQYYELYAKLGSSRAVARETGKTASTVQETLAKMMDKATLSGYLRPKDEEPELKVWGESVRLDANGNDSGGWLIKRQRGADPSDQEPMPEPYNIKQIAEYTDSEGRVTGRWTTKVREEAERQKLWLSHVERASSEIIAMPERKLWLPTEQRSADKLAVYPVGDHHLGMLAWALETGGENYDMKIARERLATAVRYLINKAPACDTALVAFLGDFFHTDSYRSVTPAHGHLLDSDVRYSKMVELGYDLIIYCIEAALEKHLNVNVIFEKGNHDPSTAAVMAITLSRHFRDNPRVTIDKSPAWFHYFQFGKVMLGTNHGDKVKPPQQPLVMATDQAKMWGETTYRMMMNGHVHHESRKEYPGCFVETFGVLAPADAFAAIGGWRSICQMHSLVFHKDGYLADRSYFYPGITL